jgi:hypothetical protein
MADTTGLQAEAALSATASPEELAEIITELEQYRERLVSDTLAMAQKAKIMKTQAMASLEPQLAQLDAQIEGLRQQQLAATSAN